jgi:hypothetical protein
MFSPPMHTLMKNNEHPKTYNVATLALGSRPKQRLAKVRAKREARECGRVWEWTLTLPSELPFWELESRWTLESSKNDCKGQKAIWMWALWRGTKYTIRGKVVASPKSGPWWVLWVRVCPWLVLAPKVLQQCTNQLIAWFCAGSCEWIVACHSS